MQFSIFNEFIFAVVIGVVQGITEFLPISSTAHLRLISEVLTGSDIGIPTSNFIQFGTLLAIVLFYKEDLARYGKRLLELFQSPKKIFNTITLVKQWFSSFNSAKTSARSEFLSSMQANPNAATDIEIVQVILATIPVIITALIFRSTIEALRLDITNIAWFLLAGGLLILTAEVVHVLRFDELKTTNETTNEQLLLSPAEVLLIGLFQSLGVFPGMSRSGSTLAGALFIGKNRKASVRFSFLLSIPALGLAGLYDGIQLFKDFIAGKFSFFPSVVSWTGDSINLSVFSLIIGFICAFFVGYFCLEWLLKFLSKSNSGVFIVYRILLASAIFAAALTGLIS